MELDPYVARLQRELLAVAAAGGDEARAVAERLVAPLDSAVRLVIIEVLAEVFDSITTEIAPGSVHMRLRGREPEVVVVPAARGEPSPEADVPRSPGGEADDGPVTRINFRPPESLKNRIEQAAARERLSVNAWLVRATSAAVDRPPPSTVPPRPPRNRLSGWVG